MRILACTLLECQNFELVTKILSAEKCWPPRILSAEIMSDKLYELTWIVYCIGEDQSRFTVSVCLGCKRLYLQSYCVPITDTTVERRAVSSSWHQHFVPIEDRID